MTILSKSQQNLLGILSLIDGTALTIEQVYRRRERNQTVLTMCKRIHKVVDQAMNAFGLTIMDQRTLAKLEHRITMFDRSTFAHREHSAPVLLSTALGLLDEPLRTVKHSRRLKTLEQIESALRALHRHFDRRLDRSEDYETATKYCERW